MSMPTKVQIAGRAKPRVLLIALEFPTWQQARHWSYAAQLGIEEGLRANEVEYLTIPAIWGQACSSPSWRRHVREICAGKRFDQVWVELVHSDLDETFLEWLTSLAPLRLGLLPESLEYGPEESTLYPHLAGRKALVERRLQYMTHALTIDEKDAEDITRCGLAAAMWWPASVPERFIHESAVPVSNRYAVFGGALYGERAAWLSQAVLQGLLRRLAPPEDDTPYPKLFDELNLAASVHLQQQLPVDQGLLSAYLASLRQIRQGVFARWLRALQTGGAVVNLPHYVKSYAGRVVEGMAAGRPVISWEIPDRPRNKALFADGKELLLYPKDDPSILATHIDRLLQDPDFANQIVANARRKLRRFHTVEKRVQQILEWLQTGLAPSYGSHEEPLEMGQPIPPVIASSPSSTRTSSDATTPQSLGLMATEGTSDALSPDRPQRVDEFYVELFVKDRYWSTPYPNPDEAARWVKIVGFLEQLARSAFAGGKPQLRILDVGCGRGWLTNLASTYGTCEGVDPVAGVIDYARQLFPHLHFDVGTPETILARPDFQPYDVVLTSEVIEHVPRGQKADFVRALHQLVKPHGHVIVTTPRGEEFERFNAIMKAQQPIEDWLTEDELHRLFTAQGFRCVGHERVYLELPNLNFLPTTTPADHRDRDLMAIYQVWAFEATPAPQGEAAMVVSARPMVSVIVPTHNRPDMLMVALKSVLRQTYRDFEIIVVNDGGIDVENIITALNQEHRITYVKHGMNKGLAAARNTGIRLARGKYIAYLDDDDRFLPDHLETLITFLETHEQEYKAAYTDAWRVHQVFEDGQYIERARDLPYSCEFDPVKILVSNYLPVLCVIHQKVCLDEIGLFDETLFSHEDWDLWIRMSRRYKFAHLKKTTAEFTWRTDKTSMTSSMKHNYIMTTEIIYHKYKNLDTVNSSVLEAQQKHLQLIREENVSNNIECSIIIPVWNKVELTKQCLIQVAEVTRDVHYEVIIVDNASTDETSAFLASLSGDVQVITNEQNLGFSKACNQGAKVARARYLVFLNNDTIPQEGWLQALVEEAQAYPDVAVVGSKLLYPDGTVQHAGVAFARANSLPYHIYRGAPANATVVNQRRELQVVTAACMLVRREAFEAVGGFDEGYRNGFEDVDLCLKVRERGGRVVYQPKSVLYHLESQTPGRKAHDAENARRLLDRWGDRWLVDEDTIYVPDGYAIRTRYEDGRVSYRLGPLTDADDNASWGLVAEVERQGLAGDIAAVRSSLAQPSRWPEDPGVLRWAAQLCRRVGVPAYAEAFWKRALACGPTPDVLTALTRVALEKGALDDAEHYLQELMAHSPTHGEGWLLRGILALQRQDGVAAQAAFEKALQHGGDARKAHKGLGMAAMALGQLERAWDVFAAVLAGDIDDAEAIHCLLRAGTALERWQSLAEYLSNYLKLNPGDLSVRFALAGVQIRRGDWEAAREQYEMIRSLDPMFAGLDDLARILERQMPGVSA
jgi:GT2 family glycosyltransferase/2-polyprenyl-3-methyl-5-hydroxy-6-metoxy-1,4-benzoquinol methylase/tetratricopeptide (TPR) repeat protein